MEFVLDAERTAATPGPSPQEAGRGMRALLMMAEMFDQPVDEQREQFDGDHHEDERDGGAGPVWQGGEARSKRGLKREGGGFRQQAARDRGGEGDEEGKQWTHLCVPFEAVTGPLNNPKNAIENNWLTSIRDGGSTKTGLSPDVGAVPARRECDGPATES